MLPSAAPGILSLGSFGRLSINDLSEAVQAYNEGSANLDEFSDWFHRASRGFWGESAKVRDLCIAIRAAFDALDYDGINEDVFRAKLEKLEWANALSSERADGWTHMGGAWICERCEMALDLPEDHVCRPYSDPGPYYDEDTLTHHNVLAPERAREIADRLEEMSHIIGSTFGYELRAIAKELRDGK